MKNKVLHNQTLLDISIQNTGSVQNCFQIALANGISVTDALTTGSNLEGAKIAVVDEDIQFYFKAKKIQPATGITENLIEIKPLGGVNYWAIEETFEIQ
ncbi:hypothetical protein [Chryseobacterium herbae]|uniref:Uncharacterized protein n=1 Tax=Chryseobacterium herbae TaxID=2976476 RepID=A0ABT2IYL4_9FLAO|nr:hypothetical protein [Chryseobacterium sp. pc1-10]MCT2563943.1 hypothetical protein [Chryseobacterium sp. pc1-10]